MLWMFKHCYTMGGLTEASTLEQTFRPTSTTRSTEHFPPNIKTYKPISTPNLLHDAKYPSARHRNPLCWQCLPVFKYLSSSFSPPNLPRIPDGEPGKRRNFVLFQQEVFAKSPFVLLTNNHTENHLVKPGIDAPAVQLLPLEYDDFALTSYATFCKLRNEGTIAPGVRFQVSLPTPFNVVGNMITPAWRMTVEPLYESALLKAVRRIQDNIPHHDLAIQWDIAVEIAYLEGFALKWDMAGGTTYLEGLNHNPPWFSEPYSQSLAERVLKMMASVDSNVEMGLHLCYGYHNHKHFVQPKDLSVIVKFANDLLRGATRPVHWLHMPVPKDRSDDAYFAPLTDLNLGQAEVFLGLLHMNDGQGTYNKMQAASRFISKFGIATECGLGRAPSDELESVVEIAKGIFEE